MDSTPQPPGSSPVVIFSAPEVVGTRGSAPQFELPTTPPSDTKPSRAPAAGRGMANPLTMRPLIPAPTQPHQTTPDDVSGGSPLHDDQPAYTPLTSDDGPSPPAYQPDDSVSHGDRSQSPNRSALRREGRPSATRSASFVAFHESPAVGASERSESPSITRFRSPQSRRPIATALISWLDAIDAPGYAREALRASFAPFHPVAKGDLSAADALAAQLADACISGTPDAGGRAKTEATAMADPSPCNSASVQGTPGGATMSPTLVLDAKIPSQYRPRDSLRRREIRSDSLSEIPHVEGSGSFDASKETVRSGSPPRPPQAVTVTQPDTARSPIRTDSSPKSERPIFPRTPSEDPAARQFPHQGPVTPQRRPSGPEVRSDASLALAARRPTLPTPTPMATPHDADVPRQSSEDASSNQQSTPAWSKRSDGAATDDGSGSRGLTVSAGTTASKATPQGVPQPSMEPREVLQTLLRLLLKEHVQASQASPAAAAGARHMSNSTSPYGAHSTRTPASGGSTGSSALRRTSSTHSSTTAVSAQLGGSLGRLPEEADDVDVVYPPPAATVRDPRTPVGSPVKVIRRRAAQRLQEQQQQQQQQKPAEDSEVQRMFVADGTPLLVRRLSAPEEMSTPRRRLTPSFSPDCSPPRARTPGAEVPRLATAVPDVDEAYHDDVREDFTPVFVDVDDSELPSPVRRLASQKPMLRGRIASVRRASIATLATTDSRAASRAASRFQSPRASPHPFFHRASRSGSPVAFNIPATLRETRITSHVQQPIDDTYNHVDGMYSVNQYLMLMPLGKGQQGEVMQAYDTMLNVMRAIKVITRPQRFELSSSMSPLAQTAPRRTCRSRSIDSLGDNAAEAVVASSGAASAASASAPTQRLDEAATRDEPADSNAAAVGAGFSVARNRARAVQFERELRLTERCQHRHTVRLHEIIDDPQCDETYMVMDLYQKGSVATIRQDGTLETTSSCAEAARCLLHISKALAHIHSLGVVHRDVKPENIFRADDGSFILGDFGMAEEYLIAAHEEQRSPESILESDRSQPMRGTLSFMAPEQLASSQPTSPEAANMSPQTAARPKLFRPTPAMDVWGLGVTTYLLLEGRLPWHAQRRNVVAVVDAIIGSEIRFRSDSFAAAPVAEPPRDIALRRQLENAICHMLDRNVRTRWSTEEVRSYVEDSIGEYHRPGRDKSGRDRP